MHKKRAMHAQSCWFDYCFLLNCERIEPRSHFKSRLSLIVLVNVVLNRTVVVDSDLRFDNPCGSHLQSQSELYHVSWWYYTLVIDLIGELRRDVIGRLSVKPWCYWLWRIVISNWCVSIRLLSLLNSRLLLVKLSVLQSFSLCLSLSKRQSLSTTVLFRTTFTRTIKLNLLLLF